MIIVSSEPWNARASVIRYILKCEFCGSESPYFMLKREVFMIEKGVGWWKCCWCKKETLGEDVMEVVI